MYIKREVLNAKSDFARKFSHRLSEEKLAPLLIIKARALFYSYIAA